MLGGAGEHLVVVHEHVGPLGAGQRLAVGQQVAHGQGGQLRFQNAAGEIEDALQQPVHVGLLAGQQPVGVAVGVLHQLGPAAVEELQHLLEAAVLQAAGLHVLHDETHLHRGDEAPGPVAERAASLGGKQPQGHFAHAGRFHGRAAGRLQTRRQHAGRIGRGRQHQQIARGRAAFQQRRRPFHQARGLPATDGALHQHGFGGRGQFDSHSLPLFRRRGEAPAPVVSFPGKEYRILPAGERPLKRSFPWVAFVGGKGRALSLRLGARGAAPSASLARAALGPAARARSRSQRPIRAGSTKPSPRPRPPRPRWMRPAPSGAGRAS